MSPMVRMRYMNVSLKKHRPPRHLWRRPPSLSLLFLSVAVMSLAFFMLTEIGIMQRKAITSSAKALFKTNHASSSPAYFRKGTYAPPTRADTFRIEPLLQRDSLSVELSAQVRINAVAARTTMNDIIEYRHYLKSLHSNGSFSSSNFTLRRGEVEPHWWDKRNCTAYPPSLHRPREISNRKTMRLAHLNPSLAPGVGPGGSWSPQSCLALHSVAVIIPYRNRWRHLTTLMNYLHPLLQRQLVRYKIYVVEQHGNETFNKGTIMNAAFLEAIKDELFHCFIFHDVDLLPETDYNMYTCPDQPRHMSVAVNELHYRLPYHVLVGGVLAIKTEHFFKVNGYSNLFWGWGGEDDDMGMRIQQSGLYITRPIAELGRYTMIKHVKRSGIEHRVRFKLVRTAKRRYRLDGLNSIQYRLLSKNDAEWFTWLLVDLGNPPPALKLV